MRYFISHLIVAICLLLAGCASYTVHPLTNPYIANALKKPDLNKITQSHHVDIDLQKPLTAKQLAIIAIFTNPDLAVLRAQEHISQAQVFAAGLLPDPIFSFSLDHPFSMVGNTNGYNIGPDFDLGALFTHSLKVKIAQLAHLKVKANIAWQEWLVANKVQLAVNHIISLRKQKHMLLAQLNIMKPYYAVMLYNYHQHHITISQLEEQKQSYTDLITKIVNIKTDLSDSSKALNLLLGFPPNVFIPMSINSPKVCLPKKFNNKELFNLAIKNRLDLKALKIQYQQQEDKVKQAIDGQYPHFNLGFAQSRDTSNVKTFGVSFSFDLPIWNRNRGNIAIARATRSQLATAYIDQLQRVRSHIAIISAHLNILHNEQMMLSHKIHSLSIKDYVTQLKTGLINFPLFWALVSHYYQYQQQLIQVNQNLYSNGIALQIAVGKTYQGENC